MKVDLKKLLKPKKFGWRFIGCDLKMPNGLLVECYIAFAELMAVDRRNHVFFERWRGKDIKNLSAEERRKYEVMLKRVPSSQPSLPQMPMDANHFKAIDAFSSQTRRGGRGVQSNCWRQRGREGAAAAEAGVCDEEVMEWLMALGIDKPACQEVCGGTEGLGVDAAEDMYALEAIDFQEIAMKMLHPRRSSRRSQEEGRAGGGGAETWEHGGAGAGDWGLETGAGSEEARNTQ